MKKRVLSVLLTLVLCFTLIPSGAVYAAQQDKQNADEIQSMATAQNFSSWVLQDLMVGSTYGVYPDIWTTKDMTGAINQAQLRVLIAGLRYKIVKTDCVTDTTEKNISLKQSYTVDDVMKIMFDLMKNYTFTKDLGLDKTTYIKFMTENGIFTGKNGEQARKDICSIEQACAITTRTVTVLYDKLDAASKGFFYVTKANGNTVYMLGSIHMANNDVYPMSNEIIKAFQSADALAVEVNLYDQAGAMDFLQYAVYTDGTKLKDHLSADTYQKIVTLAQSFGYTEQMISMYKPWYLYTAFNSLSMTNSGSREEATQGATLGIDMNFLQNAMVSSKPILEVEGYASQAKMLDSFSDGLEEYLLNETITSINDVVAGKSDSGADSLDEMLALWRSGDAEKFQKYSSFEYEYKDLLTDASSANEKKYIEELKDKLFTQRDKTMAAYIDSLLTSKGNKTYFVVVGSGHYVSDYDVIDILKEKGYEVNQIK